MEKLVPDSFIKIKIEHISGLINWIIPSLFLLYVQVEVYQNILKPIVFTLYKASSKNKKRFLGVSRPYFLYDFWRKILLMLYFINWPIINIVCNFKWRWNCIHWLHSFSTGESSIVNIVVKVRKPDFSYLAV